MEIYRIVLERYADQLYAPGFSGRWNYDYDGEFVIYAAFKSFFGRHGEYGA